MITEILHANQELANFGSVSPTTIIRSARFISGTKLGFIGIVSVIII